jgi:hypothetical protein
MRYRAKLANVVGNGFRGIYHEFVMLDLGKIWVDGYIDAGIEFDESVIDKVTECLRFHGVNHVKFEPIEES